MPKLLALCALLVYGSAALYSGLVDELYVARFQLADGRWAREVWEFDGVRLYVDGELGHQAFLAFGSYSIATVTYRVLLVAGGLLCLLPVMLRRRRPHLFILYGAAAALAGVLLVGWVAAQESAGRGRFSASSMTGIAVWTALACLAAALWLRDRRRARAETPHAVFD